MHKLLEEQGSTHRWIFFILIAGLIAISVLFILSRLFRYSGPELLNSPYSVETRARPMDIGSARMMIPENMIRHPEQRKLNQHKKLELIMLWPSLEGFSLSTQVEFSDVSKASRLIFLSLSQPDEPISSSERLYSVYSQHFVGDPVQGPTHLIGFQMAKESGFSGETIYFKPDENEPYVARCIKPVEGTPEFCMRDLILPDDVQLSYRFRKALLKDWREMDQALLDRLVSFQ